MRKALLSLTLVVALAVVAAPAAEAAPKAPRLKAGVGKADITPQTGYYLGGWTRADRVAKGQHTRLFSRAMVLERGGRKFALVQVDLFMISGGMVKQIGEILASRGFSERNILISASHTHSGPGGYANFPTLNTAAPSLQTATDPTSFASFLSPEKADPLLYAFLTRQISTAIRRADDDRAMATAGWGSAKILGLTRNRSIEAHLANHGVIKPRGAGSESDDPGGYEHTIDPDVNVLRVDKLRRVRRKGRRSKIRRVPIGAWSTFADHGTVTKSSFQFYNADHHASAMRVFEQRVRSEAKVPAKQEVLNVYGNSNEGDMSAGLTRDGPAASDFVGRVEAAAMYKAWRDARRRTSRYPAFSSRWTRVCFCGQTVEEGQQVASESEVGIPFLTGSEEERGPAVRRDRRGVRGPPRPRSRLAARREGLGVRGRRRGAERGAAAGLPAGPADDRLAARRGHQGDGCADQGGGRSQIAGSGIGDVVLSGLANEFVLYMTTPQEYDRQHYEGGNTQFGRQSGNLLKNEIAGLAGRLARNQPAPAPYDFDPTNGVSPGSAAYGPGAASASDADPAAARLRPPAARRAVMAGRPAGPGPAGGPRVRDGAAHDAQGLGRRGQRPWPGDALERGRAMAATR